MMKSTTIALVATFLVASEIAVMPVAVAQPAEPLAESATAGPSTTKLPDSPARQQFKKLSEAALEEAQPASKKQIRSDSLTLPRDSNVPKRPAAENVQRLEEIRVFGNGDPEDYVALKPAPMLVFRALLERQRPMTPKEIAQAGLCFIGLCSIYAPDGAPIEDTPEQRAERRKNAPPSQLRGTL